MIVRLPLWWLVILLPTGTQTQCTDGEIRLSGFEENEVGNWTEGSVDGRVEVCSSNLTWRVLCEPEGGWKPEDAAVVCRQLGHSPLGAQGYLTVPLDFNPIAQLENSTAQLDNSTAQLDNSTAQLDNFTTTLDNFTGQFPDCSGRESRLNECPERNVSNNTECLTTNVICQSPGTPDVKEMCVVVNGSAVNLTETVTAFIASTVQQMCMCAYSTMDLNTTTIHQCNDHVIFRILLNSNKALEESLQFLLRRLSSLGLRSEDLTLATHDCTTGCLTRLQITPSPSLSPASITELTTISLPNTTVLILTPSTVISTAMLPHMSSEMYSGVTTSTPVANHPNRITKESVAAIIGGITGGVLALILMFLILCVLLVGIWLKQKRKIASAKVTSTMPCNHKQQERKQSNPYIYEEVDCNHFSDPEHTLVNPLYYNSPSFYSQSELTDTSDLRSQGSASYLVLNVYHPEATDTQSSVSEVRETRKHSYEEVHPYLDLPKMYDQPQQHVNPYRISRPYLEKSCDASDQEPSLDIPEVYVQNTQDETERPRSRVNPYHVSKPFLEEASPESTRQQLHLNASLYKDEQGYSSLENLLEPPYATLEPFVGTMPNDQHHIDEHGYSSLENLSTSPYATLEPFAGNMPNDKTYFDDDYSCLSST